jgi:uncharacterized protein (DUF2336 family)
MTIHVSDQSTQASLIAELEGAIKGGSEERRVDTLRRVTDLFLHDAGRLSDTQVEVFDDILCHLVKTIEIKAVAELSARLAGVDNAPVEAIRWLARNDEITVAGPVLTQSPRLSTADLVELARTKGQAHLLAISGRAQLQEAVTDQLLSRGNSAVTHKLAENAGARFSAAGFATLVRTAQSDETLTKSVGLRADLPPHVLRDLLLQATATVRHWLFAHAPVEARDQVQRVLADVSNKIGRETGALRDFAPAQQHVLKMHSMGDLDEVAILGFAIMRKYEETAACLSVLASAPIHLIDALMKSHRNDGLLVPCRAAGLAWPTVHGILKNRIGHRPISDAELARAKQDYDTLSQASAQRTLRFWQVRTGTNRFAG